MTFDLNSLRPDDLDTFRRWVREQRDHYDELLKRLETTCSPKADSDPKPQSTDESDNEDVVYTILKKAGGWMANAMIREEFRRMTGHAVDRLFLRQILTGGEGRLFVRRGKARTTEWKVLPT